MKQEVFITGGTGFVGSNLILELLPHVDKIYMLVRSASLTKAIKQFTSPKIIFISGDIENHHVLDDNRDFKLLENITKVIHAAASYDLNISKEKAYVSNIVGTQNILRLVAQLPKVTHYFHISSYVVNSIKARTYHDDELDVVTDSNTDYYSWSKNMSEQLVRSFSQHQQVKVIILRPGIVIGSTKEIKNFKADGPYFYLGALIKYKKQLSYLKFLPCVPLCYVKNSPLPLVAVDYLVTWISAIVDNPTEKKLSTYHLFDNDIPSAEELISLTMNKFKLPLTIVGVDVFEGAFEKLYSFINIPVSLLKYTNLKSKYVANSLYKDYPQLERYKFKEHCDVFYQQASEVVS